MRGKTVLRHAQPKVAFAKAAAVLVERGPIAVGIHATAVVAPLAHVGKNVSIGPYAVIGEDAHIGDGTQIGAHCVIGAGCWIGENCRFHPHITMYARARVGHRVEIHAEQSLVRTDSAMSMAMAATGNFRRSAIVEIADDVEIGANATIDRGSLDDTRIAEGVKLDNLVHVGQQRADWRAYGDCCADRHFRVKPGRSSCGGRRTGGYCGSLHSRRWRNRRRASGHSYWGKRFARDRLFGAPQRARSVDSKKRMLGMRGFRS